MGMAKCTAEEALTIRALFLDGLMSLRAIRRQTQRFRSILNSAWKEWKNPAQLDSKSSSESEAISSKQMSIGSASRTTISSERQSHASLTAFEDACISTLKSSAPSKIFILVFLEEVCTKLQLSYRIYSPVWSMSK